ncbi:hypothetical protein CTheo_2969 [Ceratobasidium theobromae]|uniref:Deuterolysin metalloprotease (M35) family containing protein n=1 Tax=Ceratobasidium theobromae TaxID=1582974 RepID=A0A5N5QP98_9AGAM|nr:hypothetical protein CTheo_2969 [Ceratobasidium theobromae]
MGMFQAGNKFEKRIQSKPCVDASVDRNPMIDILMRNPRVTPGLDPGQSLGVIVDVVAGVDGGTARYLSNPTYHITMKSLNGSSLTPDDMPRIWLSNRNEYIHSAGKRKLEASGDTDTEILGARTPLYLPGWSLRPGFHIEADIGLIIRRFIKSSVMRDLLFNLDPEYAQISLYPLITASTAALSNNSYATATLSTTYQPALTYFRGQEEYWSTRNHAWEFDYDMCDFIDDYRSSTVFDVIGSVGGLFALLQAAHILLFGRPLLWGLAGTKLITPFGIVGAFSSESFKRRLHERYHRQPSEHNPEPIHIGAFLRDFVIDLGPANVDLDHSPQASVLSSTQNDDCQLGETISSSTRQQS